MRSVGAGCFVSLLMNTKAQKGPIHRVKPVYQLGLVLVGLMIAATGLRSLLKGSLHYHSVVNQPVFAPFAILVGLLMIVVVVAAWVSNK